MDLKQDLPTLLVASPHEWEAWLETHGATSRGVWLKLAKKNAATLTVSYAEALESALCHGWIDGQKAALDADFWLQRFTPRGSRSRWSRANRDKAAELLQQGRMKPAGRAQVEQAQHDGRWEAAYEGQRLATVPEDLQRALSDHPEAQAFFNTLDSTNRYAILYRLQDAKKPETRVRRLAQFVAMLEEHRKIYP